MLIGKAFILLITKLIDKKADLISTMLLASNLINILASALATSLFIAIFGDFGIIISTIMVSDISGYIFGKYFSGPKIFKKISPNKTYSGFTASVLLSVLWFSILSLIYSLHNPVTFIFIGLFIAIFSIIGDLLISYLKRKTNMKDSGIMLPGHGGLFDRADSILFVFFILLLKNIIGKGEKVKTPILSLYFFLYFFAKLNNF